jgi:hypothetical protein
MGRPLASVPDSQTQLEKGSIVNCTVSIGDHMAKKSCPLCDEQDRFLERLKDMVPKTLSAESFKGLQDHAAQIKAACAARGYRLPLI